MSTHLGHSGSRILARTRTRQAVVAVAVSPRALRARAAEAAALLKGMANPDRQMFLRPLSAAERSASELGRLAGIVVAAMLAGMPLHDRFLARR